jgi:hypothetical protein
MDAADILRELNALGVRVVIAAGRASLKTPRLWGPAEQTRLTALMPHLAERRAAVIALCSRTTDRRGMRRVLEDLDDMVAASGVSGTADGVQAVAGRALELFDAGDLDGLLTLRRMLADLLAALGGGGG